MSAAEDQGQGHWLSGLREGYAEVGDVQLHYVEAGEGPLVVLLHGFPEFWYGWRLQIHALVEAGFRVVAPDMRGYNLSSRPEGVAAYDSDHLAGARRRVRDAGRPRLGGSVAAVQVEVVVAVAAVEAAAGGGDEAAAAQQPQVVGDEVLRLVDPGGQLTLARA